MDTGDCPDGEDCMTACAVAEPGSDSLAPRHAPWTVETDRPMPPSSGDDDSAIGDAGENRIQVLLPISDRAAFLAEISDAASTLALAKHEETLEGIEARSPSIRFSTT
jgi:hypothetical protein